MPPDRERLPPGFGLMLEDGDLVFDDGALALVDGYEAIAQGIEVAILTPFGADRFNVNYGLDYARIFGAAVLAEDARERTRLEIVRTVSSNPRIASIAEIAFSDEPAFARLFPDMVTPPRSRSLVAGLVVEVDRAETLGLPLTVEPPR